MLLRKNLSKEWGLFYSSIPTPVYLFFLLYLFLGLNIVPDYGISWDESIQRRHGRVAVDFFSEKWDWGWKKREPAYDWQTYDRRHYGMIYPVATEFLEIGLGLENDFRGRFLMRHYVSFLLFWIATIFFYKLSKARFGNWRWGLLGAILLITTPRIFAHSFFNPKDLVLLSFYIISTYTLIRLLQKNNLKYALIHGFATALVINARILGIIIPALTIGLFLLNMILVNRKDWKKQLGLLFAYFGIAVSFTIMLWPHLWNNPLPHFLEAFSAMSKFNWDGELLFDGKFILASKVPWYYVPKWIGISSPPVHLLFFVLGMPIVLFGLLSKAKSVLFESFNAEKFDLIVVSLFAGPLLAVIFLKSNLYDGWRQLYFIYPMIILVLLAGFYKIRNWVLQKMGGWWKMMSRVAIEGTLVLGIVFTIYFMISYHPHQYAYFNIFAGKNLVERYDIDYWGVGYYNLFEEIAKRDDRTCIKFSHANYPAFANWDMLEPLLHSKFKQQQVRKYSNYYLTNFRFPKELERYKNRSHAYKEEFYTIQVGEAKVVAAYKIK